MDKNIVDIMHSDDVETLLPLAEAFLDMFSDTKKEIDGLQKLFNILFENVKFEVSETFVNMILNPGKYMGESRMWLRKDLLRKIVKYCFLNRNSKFKQLEIIEIMMKKASFYESEASKFRTLMNKYFDYEHTDQEAFADFVCKNVEKLTIVYDIIINKTKDFKCYDAIVLAFELLEDPAETNRMRLLRNRLLKSDCQSRTDWYNFPPELLSQRAEYDYERRRPMNFAVAKFDIGMITFGLTERLPAEYEILFDDYLPESYLYKFFSIKERSKMSKRNKL